MASTHDFEAIKSLITEYNKLICQETNEIPQLSSIPSDPMLLELYEMMQNGAQKFKEKRNSENILFGQLGLGLFALKQGNFTPIIPYEENTSMVAETIGYFNSFINEMTKSSNEISALSNAAKNGDFTLTVSPGLWQGDIKRVVDGVNSLCFEINSMLADSYENGAELAKSASVLKDSTYALSSAAAEQAAALEQTASSLEELSDAVRTNNVNSNNMAQIAAEAQASTVGAKSLAEDTATAIGEIGDATSEIKEALKTIENIASQTNILSLNAAIEATRAGAAGRGFAVVATEVRKLATRSTEAAKRIKELTELANKKSNEGIQISKQMVEGLEALSAKIEMTAKSVALVSQASNEQMNAVTQINEAVAQLDAVTQANANTAEETDQIADSVATLANNIVENANSKNFIGKTRYAAGIAW